MYNFKSVFQLACPNILTVIITACITCFVTLIILFSNNSIHYPFGNYLTVKYLYPFEDDQFILNTDGCRVKKYHPFDPSVSIFYNEETSPLDDCHERSFLIAEQNKVYLNHSLVLSVFKTDNISCAYFSVIRNPRNLKKSMDNVVGFGEPKRLEFGKPLEEEFITVGCFNDGILLFEDYLALVFLKPELEEKREHAAETYLNSDALNIIILGVDSVSKLNYFRHFPVTNGYLETTLKPFEFHGYTKVADNTFPNMVPMLTGHFVSHYRRIWQIANTYLDDFELIWKAFAAVGYRTLYAEETPATGIFNYQKMGFKYPPSDYYLRPFSIAAEKTWTKWRAKRGYFCFGHTSEIDFIYSYVRSFIKIMERRPFFTFDFVSRISHDFINRAGYADKPTFKMIKDLYESNVLNRSVLIFFSDHGIRFGTIRKTYIGKVEERMPFMFQHYPQWFLKKHPDFKAALATNQRRLTTPFDIYKTLRHLLKISTNDEKNNVTKKDSGYGQSLFTFISSGRTCQDAHINAHWCTCNKHIKYRTDKFVIIAAQEVVNSVNLLINSTVNASLCQTLHLNRIIDTYASHPSIQSSDSSSNIVDYLITIEVSPSAAILEGTIRRSPKSMKLIGVVSRINSYGNESWCVADFILKKYCFC